MTRSFVIETKTATVMADRLNSGRHIDKLIRIDRARTRRGLRHLPIGVVNRIGRVLREGVQDVGQQQFLMLLLVMQTDFENFKHARRVRVRNIGDQLLDRGIDMGAIAGDIFVVRARDQAALRARVTRAGGDIIGIEQKRKTLVENLVSRDRAAPAETARKTR